jgi:hypothetical protein
MLEDRRSVRVIFDLDRGHTVPSGRVTDERGVRTSFSGWLELMDRVECVLCRANDGDVRLRSGGDAETRER